MTSVEFTWTYPYRALNRKALEPVVPVRLLFPGLEVDCLALVDTGAERTLLDGMILRATGADIFSGRPVPLQGFLGAGMTAYEHLVRIQIGPLELELEVCFTTQPLSRQVLGRDLLAFFLLGLRERALELSSLT